jgi:hypothetical protein
VYIEEDFIGGTTFVPLDDLAVALSSCPDNQEGNTALAGYMWGNRHWTRARPPANPVDRAAEPWREHPA